MFEGCKIGYHIGDSKKDAYRRKYQHYLHHIPRTHVADNVPVKPRYIKANPPAYQYKREYINKSYPFRNWNNKVKTQQVSQRKGTETKEHIYKKY